MDSKKNDKHCRQRDYDMPKSSLPRTPRQEKTLKYNSGTSMVRKEMELNWKKAFHS